MMGARRHLRQMALVGLFLLAACGRPDGPWVSPVAFDSAGVRILAADGSERASAPPVLLVELAEMEEQHRFGLSRRPSLDPTSGMLFRFDTIQGAESGFWMFRTLIPLDIAFLDGDGTILDIQAMAPCESPNPEWCPLHSPGVPFIGALEVNQGWFSRHGVRPGDRVEVVSPPTPPAPAGQEG